MKRILFIDDDEISNFVSVRTIEDLHIADKIDSVASADEALSLIRKAIETDPTLLPNLIFLDINMPVKSGWDFLEEFRNLKKHLPRNIHIIMLTSSVYQHDRERAKVYEDVSDYTLKPLTVSDLLLFQEKYL